MSEMRLFLWTDRKKELRKDGIYVSLSRTNNGETILKAVNVNDSEYTLPLTDYEDVPVEAFGHAWVLEGTGEIPDGVCLRLQM